MRNMFSGLCRQPRPRSASAGPIIVCLNGDSELTLTNFTSRSNLVTYALVWEKVEIVDFSKIIVTCKLNVCNQLNENKIKLHGYQMS